MKISRIITYLFLLCLVGGTTLDLYIVVDASESIVAEESEPLDGEEEKKNEEKIKKRQHLRKSTRTLVSNAIEKALMNSVDLQSLYHPEITTPPPEQA